MQALVAPRGTVLDGTAEEQVASDVDVPPFTFPGTGKREWGYVNIAGDLLLGSAVKHGSSRRDQSLHIDRTETYYDFVPVVCSDELFAFGRRDGNARWVYRPR